MYVILYDIVVHHAGSKSGDKQSFKEEHRLFYKKLLFFL